jgi:hypothetical protein
MKVGDEQAGEEGRERIGEEGAQAVASVVVEEVRNGGHDRRHGLRRGRGEDERREAARRVREAAALPARWSSAV